MFPIHNYSTFQIERDSMGPDVPDGSIIIGEQIEDIRMFKDGYCYIVVLSNKVYYKRLYKCLQFTKCDTIEMISDNEKDQHPEIIIGIDEIKELYRPYQIIIQQ